MNSQYLKTLSNREILRKDDPNDVYKQPIPLDMINKFFGMDSRILLQDDTVQKQAFDQSYKNFWSFVDFNMKFDGKTTQNVNTLIIFFIKATTLSINFPYNISIHNFFVTIIYNYLSV